MMMICVLRPLLCTWEAYLSNEYMFVYIIVLGKYVKT